MRTIKINAQNFSSLEGFYNEIEKNLTEGECPWGRNLDSLEEIVYYNFNYTENQENNVINFIWLDFSKSRLELKEERGDKLVIDILEEILTSNKSLTFNKK